MNENTKVRGHFGLVYPQNTPNNTTVTTRRKSNARVLESQKRAKIMSEIKLLTGSDHSPYARSIDGVNRRWTGVRNHGPSN
jgi:hypothetical protein